MPTCPPAAARRLPRLALLSLATLAGACLPFFGSKPPPPRTSLAIERFAAVSSALGLPPAPPPLPEVTRRLAQAVESLPDAPGAHERAQQIDANAQAMPAVPAAQTPYARRSLELAVEALQQMRKPAGSKKEREQALKAVQEAVGLDDGYRAVARALVLFSGGEPGALAGVTLRGLVARLSVESDDTARRTIAEALLALAQELHALRLDPGDLAQRAGKLADAASLDYAADLRDALERASTTLRRHRAETPAFAALAADASDAVARIVRERPFELQRPAVQDALRLLTDAVTVASRTTKSGR